MGVWLFLCGELNGDASLFIQGVCVCVLQVLAFYSLYEQCEQAVENSENWLKVQAPPASEPEPLKVQLDRCRVS